jgi:hypothetical protein
MCGESAARWKIPRLLGNSRGVDWVTAPVRGWATRQRLALAALTAGLLVTAGRALWLLDTKSFSIDEFQNTHAAWLVASGKLPYRDFFDVHLPLVYQWLAVPVAAFGAEPDSIWWLRFAFAPFGALACFALWKAAAAARGSLVAGASVAAFLGTPVVARHLVEIRADVTATAFLMSAVAALESSWTTTRRGFVSGACVGLACWATQKAWVCAAAFAVCCIIDVVWNRRGSRAALLANPLAFAAGAGSVAALAGAYLAFTGSLGAWWRWAIQWALEREQLYPGFSFGGNAQASLLTAVPLLLLALAGSVKALRTLGASGIRSTEDRGLLVLLAWLAALASALVQVAPYPYAFLPALAFAALLAGRALSGWLGSAALAVLVATGQIALSSVEDNSHQREVLRKIGELTGPDDVVYDNSGAATARPHVSFFYATDALLRTQLQSWLADELPEQILQSGCTAMIRDLRFDGLPPKLQAFLREHFQPYTPDLWLYGRWLEPGGSAHEFVAPRSGTYFVQPAAAVESSNIRVDGHPLRGRTVELERGRHDVRFDGQPGFYLLWLPRNGENWRPVPEGTPRFSRLL